MTIERISFPEGIPMESNNPYEAMRSAMSFSNLGKTYTHELMKPGKHLIVVPLDEGLPSYCKEVEVHSDRTTTVTALNEISLQDGKLTPHTIHLNMAGDTDAIIARRDGEMKLFEVLTYRKDNAFQKLINRISDIRRPKIDPPSLKNDGF
jgi:hypothetical protein